jgi:uncharacterized protein (DUF1697 family)
MRYVAFLRAINTGNRRLKMDLLRAVFVEAGFENVGTYIASGNVIFDADTPPLPEDLVVAFERRVGFHSAVFLRNRVDIQVLLDHVPWRADDGVVDVSFLEREPDPEQARRLEASAVAPEEIVVRGTEVYFLRAGRGVPTTHKEPITVETLRMNTTRRGLATITQIHERFLLWE